MFQEQRRANATYKPFLSISGGPLSMFKYLAEELGVIREWTAACTASF